MTIEMASNTHNLRRPLAHPCDCSTQGMDNSGKKKKHTISKFAQLFCQKRMMGYFAKRKV